MDVEVVGPSSSAISGSPTVTASRQPAPAAWLGLLVPALLASFVRAARRVDADLLHAHWLPAGWVAARTGKPYVVQVWGTDVELARRAPRLRASVLRRARLVIAASRRSPMLRATSAPRACASIPSGVELPPTVGEEAEPPEVLYAGRLSPEKGVLELVEAARGLSLVVAGDGPLRDRVPGAQGFVPHEELAAAVRARRGRRVPVPA